MEPIEHLINIHIKIILQQTGELILVNGIQLNNYCARYTLSYLKNGENLQS